MERLVQDPFQRDEGYETSLLAGMDAPLRSLYGGQGQLQTTLRILFWTGNPPSGGSHAI